MSKPIAITQRQITAICKGAARAGFIAEIIINGVVVRLVPEAHAAKLAGGPSESDLDDELESWDEPKSGGRLNRTNNTTTGPGGYPLGSGRKGDPIQDWYDKLGFDPKTMGETEMRELQKIAEAKWRAAIPGTPLQKRERTALQQMVSFGANTPIHWSKVKNCGPDTTERLLARGFIETKPHPKHHESVEYLILTEAGKSAAEAL
ncbi:hypothetical protein [Mesorhizobium sp.]|uniref:hypothetical protein n=1 Tax=Mesorhizobium sp. TaxID=1871066 RepID=UPI000FE58833|nr:hypothetical protein [Mesorhizobium sp.]RWE78102.1 MAG: hypothetical protein EOS42_06130 [Mesorhizobium sp.]TIV30358.1 MAG: hypothetical protein E5V90_08700 [Mesorhizobium sp.]